MNDKEPPEKPKGALNEEGLDTKATDETSTASSDGSIPRGYPDYMPPNQ